MILDQWSKSNIKTLIPMHMYGVCVVSNAQNENQANEIDMGVNLIDE